MKMSHGGQVQGGLKRSQAQSQIEVQSLSVSDLKIDSITVDNEGLGFAMVDVRGHNKPYMLQLNRKSRGESLSLDLREGDGPALLEDLGVEPGDQRYDGVHTELTDLIGKPAQEEFDRMHSDGDSASPGVRALTIAEARDLPVDIKYIDDDPMVGPPSVGHLHSEESGMHYITISSPDQYSVTWEITPEAMAGIKEGVAGAEYSDRSDARFRDAWLRASYDAGLRNGDYLSPPV